ncbi:DNA topoisomerase VI subunit B [Candidatus Woesearchaeota archaeon]|nr:DNA topoisomerase VI subunit B [Candidatus Woesearchaeota archaeon]
MAEETPIALELAKRQREISIASFFEKNRHLLGFDNPRKALLTSIKEAVDNSLDACEEGSFLPEVSVEVIDMQNDRFKVIIEDNGPGIVKKQIPNIFAKLLYGSKFFKLSQSRGQQGIGISASVLYAQLTTGKPARITSKIGEKYPAHYYELHIDTQKNSPEIIKEEVIEWNKEHGTRIELDLEGSYQKGDQSIDQYLKQTAIVNPHVTIIYTNPKAEQIIFPRATEVMPRKPVEIKPHPHGVEIGRLLSMLKFTESRTLQSFLTSEFSRVGPGTAKQICGNAALLPNTKPVDITREMAEKLVQGIEKTKIIAPPTDCISPIGEDLLEKGLRKEINAEFYCAVTRPPEVYRGNPFIVEAGLAYGGQQSAEEGTRLLRYANRVPLLYQQGACAVTRSVINTAWRNYGLSQSKGALPIGPVTLVVHIASVWVPFTSESKEAIAHYPEIIKEIKLALQECGRKLASYVNKKRKIQYESKKRDYIQMFIPHIGEALKELINLKENEEKTVEKLLAEILEKKRGKLEQIEAENMEYDEDFAKIGKTEYEEEENEGEEHEKE